MKDRSKCPHFPKMTSFNVPVLIINDWISIQILKNFLKGQMVKLSICEAVLLN